MSRYRIELLIIDPQNDFMDLPGAQLPVPGASADMDRLAAFVRRCGAKIDDIHVTLDSHHLMHVAHPIMWVNSQGQNPAPFTSISADDVQRGLWQANPRLGKADGDWVRQYVLNLEQGGRYPLIIWPPHCLIGSAGHGVYPALYQALLDWEKAEFAMVDYVTKGSNYRTEHYSAVQAEVVDPNDPTTTLNLRLISTLQNADVVLLAGEARSHCVANTVRDIAATFGKDNIGKLHLLEDCSSDVPGFEKLGADFVAEMVAKGMKRVTSTDFMT